MKTLKLLLATVVVGLLVMACDTKQKIEMVENPQATVEQENPARENGKGEAPEEPAVNKNEKPELPIPGSDGEIPGQGSSDDSATDGLDGNWLPIQLDKDELHFSAEGGADTITSLHYSHWWICYGYDDARMVDGKTVYKNFVYANNNLGGQYLSFLDGGWYVAVISNECKDQLVITVMKNTTGEPRKATIEMEAGDAFTSVMIIQE